MRGKRRLPIAELSIYLLFVLMALPFAASVQSAPAREEILPVGVIQPLTGPGAGWGVSALRGAEMAVEQVNRKGVVVKGVTYRFKVIAEDDKYFADVAVDRLKKLIDRDNVKLVLGSLGSASSVAQGPICAANKVLHLTDGFDKNIIAASNTFSFMSTVMQDFHGPGYIDFLAKQLPNVRKAFLVFIDDATGQASLRITEPSVKKKGWEAILEGFQRGITEFGPLCAKAVGAKPDVVLFCSVPPGDARKIAKGLRELGYKGVLAHMGSFVLPELYKMVGDDMGVVYCSGGVGEKPYANDDYIAFYSEYVKKYGREAFTGMDVVCYSTMRVYAQAMEMAQSLDSTVIRDLLATPGKEWYHLMGGKCYTITEQMVKEKGLGSNRYFNSVWSVSTWDKVAKKEVNAGWVYPYGWTGGEFPR